MTELPITVVPERPADGEAIEKLHRRTFGPGRFTRTAFRIREQAPHDPKLSFTAHVGTMIVGSVRLTAVTIGTTPALLLGPLTVEPPFRSVGIGARLMEVSMDAARAAGHRLIILVGDAP
ncbi:MAG: GNAT family N-acetyltransferase, partial [Rhizobiales bacterium 35-68-8]